MKTLNIIFILLIAGSVIAQPYSELQYAAYLKASKTLWLKSVEQATNEFGSDSFERAMALYGLLNSTMASEDEETFDGYVDQTTDLLKQIIDSDPKHGEAHAVLSATYGLAMAYSPMKGMFLGSKSSSLMEKAIILAPESPLVQKLYAGWKLHTPSMFGGDEDEAVKAFQKAIQLFEKGETANNWLYADALVWLAISYQKIEKKEDSREVLTKAVSFEPDFYWAKSLLAKMDKS